MSSLMETLDNELAASFPDENSFQRLFWEQQLKFQKSKKKTGMRWHPMIIKWCLYMRSKSAKCYESMREAGFISLPSSRTLYDYTRCTRAATGFQDDATSMLKDEAKLLGLNNQNWLLYVGLLQDEIRLKSGLVYDRVTGELVGYTDLDKFGNSLTSLENELEGKKPELARYMLVVMVRGIASNLKFPLAAFATNGITADLLYGIMLKAVEIVELQAELKVMFITCDGASPNRRFFEMHRGADEGPVYRVNNDYALDEDRYLYFISDVPHLLKTIRNCFANSYSMKKSRKLWRCGKTISWMHVVDLYKHYIQDNVFSTCPKITRAHIDLTSFSCMKVNLAAQIMSETVGSALEHHYGDSVSETVKFIRTVNKFFDVLNTRSTKEGTKKRNQNLDVYTNPDDPRLSWLENDFLTYFQEWKDSVQNRQGNFTPHQKASMQLSHQTITGIHISVLSIVECTRFLLQKGMPFVRTAIFNQDPLEGHFGHYRHKGGANDNPTVYEVRQTLSQLRTVGSQALAPIKGNTKRGLVERTIDNTPLRKRRK